jgi:hypothetical protein
LVLTAAPADAVPAPLRLPSGVELKSEERLWVENFGEIDCQGRRCSTDFASSMELKERPAGTPEQRLRSELAQKDHPGGPGRIIGPVHHVGRRWTAQWDRGFVSLVEIGERDLWLWLVSPANPEGADRDWEETKLGLPAGKVVRAILDNYAVHKHPKVRAWLDRHPRWTFHFTPTSASWLNAVEGFFAKLAKRRLRRGVFESLVEVQAAIKHFIAESDGDPKPFVWTADPDRIIQAAKRGHQALDSHH